MFRKNLFNGWRKIENVLAIHRPERPSLLTDRPEKHKLCRGRWVLASSQVASKSVQRLKRRSNKCIAKVAIFVHDLVRKSQTWLRMLEFLFPVQLHQNPFSGFWGVENVENYDGRTTDKAWLQQLLTNLIFVFSPRNNDKTTRNNQISTKYFALLFIVFLSRNLSSFHHKIR